jgi:hypothetical protein
MMPFGPGRRKRMNIWLVLGTIVLALCVTASVTAWGMVQILDIMEALDLRRIERARQLQKAREYLRNPSGQENMMAENSYPTPSTGQYPSQYPMAPSGGTWTGTNTNTATATQHFDVNQWYKDIVGKTTHA